MFDVRHLHIISSFNGQGHTAIRSQWKHRDEGIYIWGSLNFSFEGQLGLFSCLTSGIMYIHMDYSSMRKTHSRLCNVTLIGVVKLNTEETLGMMVDNKNSQCHQSIKWIFYCLIKQWKLSCTSKLGRLLNLIGQFLSLLMVSCISS